jgi:hypothetical protein
MNQNVKKAITTKYRAPTNTRSACIVATDNDGNTARLGYEAMTAHEFGEPRHRAAAVLLSEKMGWSVDLVAGALGGTGNYVFVEVPRSTAPATVPTPTRYTVTMRHPTTGGTESDTITIHPGQDAEQEAARHAAGYGAMVEKLEPYDRESVAVSLLERFATDATLTAADMVRLSREFTREAEEGPPTAATLRDMLRRVLPHVHIADAGPLYDEARAMI